jgi:hypothetical protein
MSKENLLTLQHAIEIFGNPQSVVVTRAGEYTGVSFVTPQAGILFSYTSWGQGRQPELVLVWKPKLELLYKEDWSFYEIRPEAKINSVFFFAPKEYQMILDHEFLSFFEMNAEETAKMLYPWRGYGSLNQYLPTDQYISTPIPDKP